MTKPRSLVLEVINRNTRQHDLEKEMDSSINAGWTFKNVTPFVRDGTTISFLLFFTWEGEENA
jgi:hypothetical protein